jgi:hypothetical protein
MRIARVEVQEGQGQLPPPGGVGRREDQDEAPVGGAQDAGGQGVHAAEHLAQAQPRQAADPEDLPPRPPVESVGGEQRVQEERLQAGEAPRPEAP